MSRVNSTLIKDSVRNRIAPVPMSNDYQRVAVNIFSRGEYVVGDICLFSPGQMQALLSKEQNEEHRTLDETLRNWSISEQKAPDGHEYLQGIGYWLAIGDHFYQVQHVSIKAKAMEEYLTWLLREQA